MGKTLNPQKAIDELRERANEIDIIALGLAFEDPKREQLRRQAEETRNQAYRIAQKLLGNAVKDIESHVSGLLEASNTLKKEIAELKRVIHTINDIRSIASVIDDIVRLVILVK